MPSPAPRTRPKTGSTKIRPASESLGLAEKRILFVGPLTIDFEVREAERTVLVLRVRRTKRVR